MTLQREKKHMHMSIYWQIRAPLPDKPPPRTLCCVFFCQYERFHPPQRTGPVSEGISVLLHLFFLSPEVWEHPGKLTFPVDSGTAYRGVLQIYPQKTTWQWLKRSIYHIWGRGPPPKKKHVLGDQIVWKSIIQLLLLSRLKRESATTILFRRNSTASRNNPSWWKRVEWANGLIHLWINISHIIGCTI